MRLAAAQLALALDTAVGAGVLLASFYRLQRVDLGFRVDHVLTFEVNLPSVRYDAERRAAFQEELARRLRTIPGVDRSRRDFVPSGHWKLSRLEYVHHQRSPSRDTRWLRRDGFNIQQRTVSGDVFGALRIPLLAGRTFDARDDETAPSRAVVSANFARAAFPGMPFDSVIGQRISAGGRPTLEIIGVVGDVALDVYGTSTSWSITRIVSSPTTETGRSHRSWRPTIPPERILADVRAAVSALDPELVVYRPRQ